MRKALIKQMEMEWNEETGFVNVNNASSAKNNPYQLILLYSHKLYFYGL